MFSAEVSELIARHSFDWVKLDVRRKKGGAKAPSSYQTEEVELEKLIEASKEAQRNLEDVRSKRSAAADTVQGNFGPGNVYMTLKEDCLDFQWQKYTYKVCLYGTVKQDHTLIGKYSNDVRYGVPAKSAPGGVQDIMQFSDGEKCWNGPKRSAKVIITCAHETKVLSVDEVSTCVYEMRVQSPAACKGSKDPHQDGGHNEL